MDSFFAVLDHDFDNGWLLRNTFRVAHYDRFYQNVYAGSAVSSANTLTISAYNNANQRTNYFNQTDATRKFRTGAIDHTVLAGIELGHQDSANQRPDGVFGTDTFLLLAGLRYDRFKVDFDDQRTVVPPVDLARTDTGASPRIGLVWTPTAASSYYVSYSYAFLPSGEQLGLATTTADLAPEKARNYEVGARWDMVPSLTLSAAVFRLDRDDVRSADPQNRGFFVKTGEQRTEGAELGLQGERMPGWLVFGGYTYLDSRVRKPFNSGTAATVATIIPAGNHVGLTPRNAFSMWNRFTFAAGWVSGWAWSTRTTTTPRSTTR